MLEGKYAPRKMRIVSDEHIWEEMIIREHLFLAPCVGAAGGEHRPTSTHVTQQPTEQAACLIKLQGKNKKK